MAGKTLDLDQILNKDDLACRIATKWLEWNTLRQPRLAAMAEVRKYLFATDTTTTTNSSLPWKNKTTLPKLTQIRDNLYANYNASLFPKRKWLYWEGESRADQNHDKAKAIENLSQYWISRPEFKLEMGKVVLDYIDCGNGFIMPVWDDRRQLAPDGSLKEGWVGPMPMRISPYDIVFNPIAPNFQQTPKIIRTMMTIGELKAELSKYSTDDNREEYSAMFDYLVNIRTQVWNHSGDFSYKDAFLQVDGFNSFSDYLKSDYVEILTFYGDMYDINQSEFYQNHVITIIDRHKLISKKPNPTAFGFYPIFHCGWRVRQDDLWAMGPLDNLVGLQYRLDHVENMKNDALDLSVLPMQKIKGHVLEYEYGPMSKVYCPDPDSDVEFLFPAPQALQTNIEIQNIMDTMEAMAGSPKEAMGFRTPGEKTAYEVSRLENAAARMFANKIIQFEEQIVEQYLNAALDMSQRLMDATEIRVFDPELNIQTFMEISKAEITGHGRIRAIAARNFAERAERIQNLTNFYASAIGQDPEIKAHISTVKLAQMIEDLLDLQDYEIVSPYIRLAEEAQAVQTKNTLDEQVGMATQTPSGLTPEDASQPFTGGGGGSAPPGNPVFQKGSVPSAGQLRGGWQGQ